MGGVGGRGWGVGVGGSRLGGRASPTASRLARHTQRGPVCVDEETATSTPFALISEGMSSLASKKWPRWFAAIVSSQPTAFRRLDWCMAPALQTSASQRPKRATKAWANLRTVAGADRSSGAKKSALSSGACVRRSASRMAAAAFVSERHAKITVAPRATSFVAVSKPIPADAPVTITTAPSRSVPAANGGILTSVW